MTLRRFAVPLLLLCSATPTWAQSAQEIGEMRLYIQQLEDRVRQLTGDVERLTYELNQARAGTPQMQPGAGQLPQGAWQSGGYPPPQSQQAHPGSDTLAGGPGVPPGEPRDFSTMSIPQDDPRIAADGDGLDGSAPLDLSALAGGAAIPPPPGAGDPMLGAPIQPQAQPFPAAPDVPITASLGGGTAREEYDVAYGYVLTGEYDMAEARLNAWLEAFPNEAQAADARFWLGESQFQQGKYREAANAFLNVYKTTPQSRKAPDSLMKLGMSLGQLGEKDAACATLSEFGRRYPDASATLKSRVDDGLRQNGC
ncbi:tol-pal system protein YbgF [Faunimonas sp. B44]|uniref:tol-pal system protein YbgF n=1 Tax=Faunimonas sp. B44 TaxID=3461493 RepID=UPI004043F2C3